MQIRTDPFEDAYELYEDLGSGQFAIVRRCKEKKTQLEYAAKFVTKRRPNSGSRKGLFREKILQEIEILSELKHNNIISLHEVFETQHEIILVLELVAGGELFEYISEKDHLSESDAAKFITQILEGVEHFHAKNIVHLDLKPENVMLLDRNNCLIKIIDFGISRKLKPGEKVMETYGTPEFVAPEIIQYQPISTATDMWSIGVITYILLSGASPFLGDSKQETFANITNIDYSFDDEYFGHTSDLAKDFISRLFVKDVRKRATVKDCLEHAWIKPRRRQDEELRRQAQINIEQFKSFIARRRWKQSLQAVLICNRIIRKSQMRLSLTLSLENINCVSFGKTLLDNGDDFVLTAILCAAEDGDIRNLKELFQILPSIDVNRANKNKETALHIACFSGKLDIIKLLQANKVDLHARDINGENAIHFSCRCNNIESAKNIIEYLAKNGVSLDVQNKNGETPLHIASRYGCVEIVRYLCEFGANLDIQDDQMETALHVASWHGFPDIVKYFCHFGSDVNLKNKEGETALIVACARGCIESVKTLTEHKADLNCRDKRGNTALHWAVRRHYTIIALLLIQAECNMDVLDSNGETALHIACRENLLPVVQTMCALGCRVDIKNKKEMTPLHTATEKNEIDAVRCLCLAGLDLSITNKDGLTAEQLATSLKHVNIANLLSSLRREQNREMFIEQLVPTNDPLRRLKIKIFGSSGAGKSTLIGSMNCSYINSFFRKTRIGGGGGGGSGSANKQSVKKQPKKQRTYPRKRNDLQKIGGMSESTWTAGTSVNSATLNSAGESDDENSYNENDGNNDTDDDQNSDYSNLNGSFNRPNILDSYENVNKSYTRGIEINQCTFSGSNHFSIWEFSGYDPYQIFYDHFIGDQNCIHVICYNLNQSQAKCFKDCVYWLEFLRARIVIKQPQMPSSLLNDSSSSLLMSSASTTATSKSSSSTSSSPLPSQTPTINNNGNLHEHDLLSNLSNNYGSTGNRVFPTGKLRILFIGTHADLDKTCVKKEDGQYTSEKAQRVKSMIESYYSNDDLFDLSEKHFVLDARAAWVTDIKQLIQYLIKLKQSICERLPRCTMFLNRTLFHLQNWRKNVPVHHVPSATSSASIMTSSFSSMSSSGISTPTTPTSLGQTFQLPNSQITHRYPIITWKQFVEQIRENINPLASDEHLHELMQQLQLMGEVIFIESDYDNDMICYQPEWLCHKILGRLFSHERYFQVKPNNLNGAYTIGELSEIFADVCTNVTLLRDLFVSLDLCAEWEMQSSYHGAASTPTTPSLHHPIIPQTMYEFASLNFLSEPLPLSFHTIKNYAHASRTNPNGTTKTLFVFNGFQIKCSTYHLDRTFKLSNAKNNTATNLMTSSMSSSAIFSNPIKTPSHLASLFFRIQANLRYLTTTNYYLDIDEIDSIKKDKSPPLQPPPHTPQQSSAQKPPLVRNQSKLDTLLETPPSSTSSSYPNTTNNTMNILQSPSLSSTNTTPLRNSRNYYSNGHLSSSVNNLNHHSNHHHNNHHQMNGALIDIDLYQTRYCSRLMRKSCSIECLVSLDHINGEFIELRACAPDTWREELFYFVQDLYSLIEQIISDSCSSLNLEKHYLSFKPLTIPNMESASANLGLVSYDTIYTPKDVIKMQYESSVIMNKKFTGVFKSESAIKFTDLVCCGSENIEKSLLYGIDLSVHQMNPYTRRMLCIYLDKSDPMGRDWSILAFLLGLQDFLPKLDEAMNQHQQIYGQKVLFSKCDCVLNEWCKQRPEQATIRYLLNKISDLDRKDVYEMMINTINLFQTNMNNDSGIQNSNQTLASLK